MPSILDAAFSLTLIAEYAAKAHGSQAILQQAGVSRSKGYTREKALETPLTAQQSFKASEPREVG